jgi:replicative DNA helicase
MYRENDEEGIKKLRYKIGESYNNVNFSFKTALTVKNIRESIEYQEKITGNKIRLVVIDYLECINSSISDSNAKIATIAQELKDLANDLETCVLLLLQPPKRAGDPSCPLLSYSDIKGAATVAQACSVVVSLWREGFHPKFIEDDRYMSFAVLKNRMGTLSQVDCGFDGLTGEVTDLDDAEKQALKELRDMKLKERENEDEI